MSPLERVRREFARYEHLLRIEHPQFAWTSQRYLCDCLHDYLCEMSTRNPQQINAEEEGR